MKPSHISYGICGSIIFVVFLLQWFQPPHTVIPERRTAIEGVIDDAPDVRATKILYTVVTSSGKVLVTDRRMWPRFAYGDRVRVTGTLKQPKPTETFAYDNYLSLFDIYTVMDASFMRVLPSPSGRGLPAGQAGLGRGVMSFLITLRNRFESEINRVYPEPHASLLAGLLTGSRRGMPAHLTLAFKQTGLTHIIAISGTNITIVLSVIGGILFFLPLRWRFLPSIIAITAFTLLVGASASVVRAAIMGILGLVALQTGRLKEGRLLILWTATLMLLWNPKYLWYDAGFQLSFLAVIGLNEFGPILKIWLRRVPNTFKIRETLTMTIAAQIFAMPWVVYSFGTLSLISPLANILVAPLVPFAMLFGFLGTILSWIFFPLGQLVGYIGWGLLELIIDIATYGAKIPYASLTTPGVSVWVIGLYYVMVIGGLLLLRNGPTIDTQTPSSAQTSP